MNPTTIEKRGLSPIKSCVGILPGYRLSFNTRGSQTSSKDRTFSNVEEFPKSIVYGIVYWLPYGDIYKMDIHEYKIKYHRELLPVIIEDKITMAIVYIVRNKIDLNQCNDLILRPSRRYINLMIEGCIHHKLPHEYIVSLKNIQVND